MSPTAPQGNADDASRSFLEVVGERAAHERRAEDGHDVWRVVGLIVVTVAGVVALWAMFSAADSSAGPVMVLNDASVVVAVSVPPEPAGFRMTEVWTLTNPNARVVADERGQAAVAVAETATGFVVGLRDDSGSLVALSVVPPLLNLPGDQLLVSPESTALGLVALHPTTTASDPDTYLARLVVAATSPELTELAALVDGSATFSELSPQMVEAIERIAISAVGDDVPPSCDAFELVGTPPAQLARCSDGSVENLGSRWVVVSDGDGAPCAAVPPATRRADQADVAALARLLSAGVPVTSGSVVTTAPGSIDASAACGANADTPIGVSDDIELSAGLHGYLDDALPLVGYIGGPLLTASAPTLEDPEFLSALRGFVEPAELEVTTTGDQVEVIAQVLAPGATSFSLGIETETAGADLIELLRGLYS